MTLYMYNVHVYLHVHVVVQFTFYSIIQIILSCTHPLHSLLLYGMLCCLDERYPEAGEFFELATTTDPNSVIAWTIRGKHYYYYMHNKKSQYTCT